MDLNTLRQTQETVAKTLSSHLAGIRKGYVNRRGRSVQLSTLAAIARLRSTGLLQYLLDGDRIAVFNSCHQAALAFDRCNRGIRAGMPHDPQFYSLCSNRGFFDALLALGAKGSRDMMVSVPSEMQSGDHPVTFPFMGFLKNLVQDDAEKCETLLEWLGKAGQGGEPIDVERNLCESLRDRDSGRFDEALVAYLDRRQEEIEQNDDVIAGEQYVSVEGLALRRLSAELGVEVTVDHGLVPADLQHDYPPIPELSSGELAEAQPGIDDSSFWSGWEPVEEM